MKPFSMVLLAALTCALTTPVWGDVILPAAVGSVLCNSNNPVTSVTDPSACELEGGLASASVMTAPSVHVVSHAGAAAGIASFNAFGSLQYSFEVIGGSAGDHVPLLIAATLDSSADPHTFGSAQIAATTSLTSARAAVCTDGTCPLGTSFSGTLDIEAVSGQVGTMELFTQASNTFLLGGTADASADPFIFVDPSFPGASTYSVLVSDGVGNGLTAVPEPAGFVLLGIGLAVLACSRRTKVR
jgi:hypothetical protein